MEKNATRPSFCKANTLHARGNRLFQVTFCLGRELVRIGQLQLHFDSSAIGFYGLHVHPERGRGLAGTSSTADQLKYLQLAIAQLLKGRVGLDRRPPKKTADS